MASMNVETTTVGEISDTFKLSKNHLMKVISALVASGHVNSIRGKKGGISLAKDANKISLKEIVILMEKTLEPFDCSGQNCLILNSCRLKHALNGAQDKYLEYLGHYTIADMLNKETTVTIHG